MVPPLRKRRGQSLNDFAGVLDQQSELFRSRVFGPWLSKDNRRWELGVHIHLRVQRHPVAAADRLREVQLGVAPKTRDLCAIFHGGTWLRGAEIGDHTGNRHEHRDLRGTRDTRSRSVDEPMLIGVREAPEGLQAWQSRDGLIRLHRFDHCDVLEVDEIEESFFPFLRRLVDLPDPVIWVVEDRKLVTPMISGSGKENELIDEVVEGAANVVDYVPECDPPFNRDLVGFFERDDVRLISFIELGHEGLSIVFKEGLQLGVQRVEVLFRPIELGSTSGKIAHGGKDD
jgi:hypothetical protein